MKRSIAFVLVVIIMVSCAAPCFAESHEHGVFAKYVETNANCVRSAVRDGTATVTLPNGITVTVSKIQSDDYILYVRMIGNSEKVALQWFSRCLEDNVETFYPLDIYLLDGTGRVTLTNAVDVQITYPHRRIDKAFFVDTDGKVREEALSADKKTVSVQTKLDAYCVIVPDETNIISPQTGDYSNIIMWCALAGIILSMTVLFFSKQKKENI